MSKDWQNGVFFSSSLEKRERRSKDTNTRSAPIMPSASAWVYSRVAQWPMKWEDPKEAQGKSHLATLPNRLRRAQRITWLLFRALWSPPTKAGKADSRFMDEEASQSDLCFMRSRDHRLTRKTGGRASLV